VTQGAIRSEHAAMFAEMERSLVMSSTVSWVQ